jgi:hypothetical protein
VRELGRSSRNCISNARTHRWRKKPSNAARNGTNQGFGDVLIDWEIPLKKGWRHGGKDKRKAEGDEPDPRHWRKTAVAASFPT